MRTSLALSRDAASLVCSGRRLTAVDVSGYLCAVGVHPTPFDHRLLAGFASDQMEAAG